MTVAQLSHCQKSVLHGQDVTSRPASAVQVHICHSCEHTGPRNASQASIPRGEPSKVNPYGKGLSPPTGRTPFVRGGDQDRSRWELPQPSHKAGFHIKHKATAQEPMMGARQGRVKPSPRLYLPRYLPHARLAKSTIGRCSRRHRQRRPPETISILPTPLEKAHCFGSVTGHAKGTDCRRLPIYLFI